VSHPSDPRGIASRSVIHDIGYRPYTGLRVGDWAVAWSLFVTGLRNCYGLGRSGKSKVLPLLLLVFIRRSTYALVRLASLTVAVFVLLVAPLLLLLAGGLLADLTVWGQVRDFLAAAAAVLVLAAILAGLSGLVAAVTTKRGLGVAAVIVVLLVSYTVVSSIQGIAVDQHEDTLGQAAGLFSPFTLVDGLQHWVFGAPASTPAPPEGIGMGVAFLLVTLLALAGSVGGLLLRYRKAGSV